MLGKGYLCAGVTQDAANWLTPATVQIQRTDMQKRIDYRASIGRKYVPGSLEEQMQQHGLPAPANPSTDGSRQGLWPTITAHTPDMESSGPKGNSGTYLAGAVKSWLTPKVPSGGSQTERTTAGGGLRKLEDQTQTQAGKLNPRWVETLQGVCMGWTSPSCPASVIRNWPKFVSGWCALTIEPTNCASSATESCLPPQSELFAF
jgi:hypothetical protein